VEEIDALATRVVMLESGRVSADVPVSQFVSRAAGGSLLHLLLDTALAPRAVDVLRARGFDARLNGRGVFVTVSAGHRVEPIHVLTDARIHVRDFEMIAHDTEAGHP
jgi:ABC-type uncharacterized transport system ATPase subunit